MTAFAVSVIVAIIAFLLFGWLRSKNAEVASLKDKTEALETAAKEEREKEQAEDEALAKEIIASGDVKRAIGFLRDSLSKAKRSL